MYSSVLFRLTTLIILLLPFGQLTRLPFAGDISIYLHDGVIALIAVVWLTGLLQKKVQKLPTVPTKHILVFATVGLVSLLFALPKLPLPQIAISSLYLVRWIVYALVFFATLGFSAAQKKKLLSFLLYSGVVFAVLGLLQYGLYPDLRNLYYAGWDPHLSRVFSTFLDPNFAGIYIGVTLLLVLSQFEAIRRPTITEGIFIITLSAALFLTYSRSSYIAFLAGLFVLSIVRRKARYFFGIALLFLAILLFLPRSFGEGVKLTRTATIHSRLTNWQEAFTVFQAHPIIGVGFNAYRYRRLVLVPLTTPSHAAAGVDNSYLFLLATSGVVGLGSYGWLWVSVVRTSIRETVTTKALQLSTITAIFVHAFFVNTLFYAWIMVWLWIFLGVTNKSSRE